MQGVLFPSIRGDTEEDFLGSAKVNTLTHYGDMIQPQHGIALADCADASAQRTVTTALSPPG